MKRLSSLAVTIVVFFWLFFALAGTVFSQWSVGQNYPMPPLPPSPIPAGASPLLSNPLAVDLAALWEEYGQPLPLSAFPYPADFTAPYPNSAPNYAPYPPFPWSADPYFGYPPPLGSSPYPFSPGPSSSPPADYLPAYPAEGFAPAFPYSPGRAAPFDFYAPIPPIYEYFSDSPIDFYSPPPSATVSSSAPAPSTDFYSPASPVVPAPSTDFYSPALDTNSSESGTNSNNDYQLPESSPSEQVAPVSADGVWIGTWTSTFASTEGFSSNAASINLTQDNDTVTGVFLFVGHAVVSSLEASGTVNGNQLQMSATVEQESGNSLNISFEGAVNGYTWSGEYTIIGKTGAAVEAGEFVVSRI